MRVGGGKKGDDSSVDTERDPPKKHPHAHYLVDTFRQKIQQKDHSKKVQCLFNASQLDNN